MACHTIIVANRPGFSGTVPENDALSRCPGRWPKSPGKQPAPRISQLGSTALPALAYLLHTVWIIVRRQRTVLVVAVTRYSLQGLRLSTASTRYDLEVVRHGNVDTNQAV